MIMTTEKLNKKKKVLVGIQLDECTKELLDWALVKVADAGDHVIAVHVCRNSDSASRGMALLDSCLADYEGLCDEKQIDLTCQLLKGNSIRRVLVREAKNNAAEAVILGINRHRAFGSALSMAKYCAKRLPISTEVLAIHNGKVVFQRFSHNNLLPGLMGDPRPSLYLIGSSLLRDTRSEFGESDASEMGRQSCEGIQSLKDEDYSSPTFENRRKALSSVSVGWPLLRTGIPATTPTAMEARKMSVVKWVMNLPSRSLPETPPASSSSGGSREVSPKSSDGELVRSSSRDFEKICNDCDSSKGEELPEILSLLLRTHSSGCRWIGYDALKIATSHFSAENLIGKGGCNRVYKGTLPDGEIVAVKVMKSSREAWKYYILEIDVMTSLSHKNVTPLIGICAEVDELISVYNFMPRGNLEQNLHPETEEKSILPGNVRCNIAVGIAEALNYLHGECSQPVIHRDIKSSNILLSDEYEPQLSDFGLAVWGPTNSTFSTHNDVVGTFGYLAPEYFMYGKVSEKIDVYSFGVILLELLTGKRPISLEGTKGEESLVMWAMPKLEKGDLGSILDPNLGKDVDKKQTVRMALAAALCLTRAARLRPKMSQILKILKGDEEAGEAKKYESDPNESGDTENDDEVYPESKTESHLSIALLDIEYKSTMSFSSVGQNTVASR